MVCVPLPRNEWSGIRPSSCARGTTLALSVHSPQLTFLMPLNHLNRYAREPPDQQQRQNDHVYQAASIMSESFLILS